MGSVIQWCPAVLAVAAGWKCPKSNSRVTSYCCSNPWIAHNNSSRERVMSPWIKTNSYWQCSRVTSYYDDNPWKAHNCESRDKVMLSSALGNG